MRIYFDTNLLVALLTNDPLSTRADALLQTHAPSPVISDFAAAEFASALARRVRVGDLAPEDGRSAFATFDAWVARIAARYELTPPDVALATTFLRRLDLPLRTPDALHIAMVQRLGASLATFDSQMAECARKLGTSVIDR